MKGFFDRFVPANGDERLGRTHVKSHYWAVDVSQLDHGFKRVHRVVFLDERYVAQQWNTLWTYFDLNSELVGFYHKYLLLFTLLCNRGIRIQASMAS